MQEPLSSMIRNFDPRARKYLEIMSTKDIWLNDVSTSSYPCWVAIRGFQFLNFKKGLIKEIDGFAVKVTLKKEVYENNDQVLSEEEVTISRSFSKPTADIEHEVKLFDAQIRPLLDDGFVPSFYDYGTIEPDEETDRMKRLFQDFPSESSSDSPI